MRFFILAYLLTQQQPKLEHTNDKALTAISKNNPVKQAT